MKIDKNDCKVNNLLNKEITEFAVRMCEADIAFIEFTSQGLEEIKIVSGCSVEDLSQFSTILFSVTLTEQFVEINDVNLTIIQNENSKEILIKYFSSMPIITKDCLNIGTLNIAHSENKSLSDDQKMILSFLVDQILIKVENVKYQHDIYTMLREKMAFRSTYAIAEFDVNGNIIEANENFQKLFGYEDSELIGKNHSMFLSYAQRKSRENKIFWENLKNHTSINSEFKRITNNDTEIWIRGNYNPVSDTNGNVFKIILTAIDITEEKYCTLDVQQKLSALSLSNDIIEFDLDGNILTANDKFLKFIEYSQDEIIGQHHSIFVSEHFKNTIIYKEFWEKLRKGIFQSGEFECLSKSGKMLYMQGTFITMFQ